MSSALLDALRHTAVPLSDEVADIDAVLARIGEADVVLLGEATHGTAEFYRWRAAITRALIERRGFTLVALEADWPDAGRVSRWVQHVSDDDTADAALDDFRRFPRWMWRNTEVVAFIEWLRDWNAGRTPAQRVSVHGLDLYSLHTSIEEVLAYLDKVDPAAAAEARERYACFDHFEDDSQAYGYAVWAGLSATCRGEVVAQLTDLRRRAGEFAARGSTSDEYFYAEQNARLVRNAEEYYRAMFAGRVESWNRRDTHMMETLEALRAHQRASGDAARVVVWAHNSHLGDARATQMGAYGELNLGQLVRQAYGDTARLVGFTTHTGTVTAAHDWGAPAHRRRVVPSLDGSYERLFHDVGFESMLVDTSAPALHEPLRVSRLQRAIGVIYRPDTERASHYFRAHLSDQFDLVLHLDTTTALHPLDGWQGEDADLPVFMT